MYGIIAFLSGVALAQGIKSTQALFKKEEFWRKRVYNVLRSIAKSGGMPSGHTLSLTALTTYLGLEKGFFSPEFAIGFGATFWFAYDAVHARRSVGEQCKVINKLVDDIGEARLQLIEGHTLPEVIVGSLLGVAVGAGTFFLLG